MAAPAYPFLRKVELSLSSVPEWRGGGSQQQMVTLKGDGTTSAFRIRFEVRKHIISTPAPTYIYIYNLSKALRQKLQQIASVSGPEIILKIGWSNVPLVTFFTGTLLAAYSERQGPDIVTSLVSMAAYGGQTLATVSQTFGSGTPLSTVIEQLASKIDGVTSRQIKVGDAKIQSQGYSTAGSATDALNDLSRTYGFDWHIDNKCFYALGSDQVRTEAAVPVISYKNGYLMRIEPILVDFMQISKGVTIQSLINPQVNVGAYVQVESELNPQLSNKYRVHTMNAAGDTHGNEWTMRLESFKMGAGG